MAPIGFFGDLRNVDAARTLFLRKGYAGTTMEDVAARAGLTKRTVYNNYADKQALFTEIVTEVIAYAEAFARDLRQEFTAAMPAAQVAAALDDLGRRRIEQLVVVRLEPDPDPLLGHRLTRRCW